ncbi:MAG: hypothetical protein HQ568_07455, partial [Calditrichaeota bacterium]|nr:hypothetical protein [Calditrichota bacterium]
GQGYTQWLGRYREYLGYDDPAYMWNNGNIPLQGSKNNYRLPSDHRLDLTAAYNHLMFKHPAKLTISIFNVYNRRSHWMRIIIEDEELFEVIDVKLLPMIPMVSYEVRF